MIENEKKEKLDKNRKNQYRKKQLGGEYKIKI